MLKLPTPTDDGLVIPEVGSWSADKHHFLLRYVDAFTTAMRKKGWSGLHYIDLFAGAGIERIKGSTRLDWGSPLIASQAPYPFQQLHLCELDKVKANALRQRVDRFPQPTSPQILNEDANQCVNKIVGSIPPHSLSLAFLDPFGLHLHLDTIRALAQCRCDLILFFPDHLDALRNWNEYYFNPQDSNLDCVLGTTLWREKLSESNNDAHAQILRQIYESQLRTLGYEHFDYERINRDDGRSLYLLVFCSRSKAGGVIWHGIAKRKRGGQDDFGW